VILSAAWYGVATAVVDDPSYSTASSRNQMMSCVKTAGNANGRGKVLKHGISQHKPVAAASGGIRGCTA